MPKLTELKGKRFGKLLVIGKVRRAKKQVQKWRCECDCGRRVTVAHYCFMRKGNPKTHCGCETKTLASEHPRTYHAWWDAKSRCHNPDHPSYPSYGAKGIRMCDEWRESFEAFIEYIKPRPNKKYSLDRIDPHGNYEPGNVRWATVQQQAWNKKETKMVKHPKTGKLMPAGQAAASMGMRYQQFRYYMMKRGEWDE